MCWSNNKYQQDRIFPLGDHANRAICVPGTGSVKGFSALVVDRMPDLEVVSKSQCFPRWRYEQQDAHQRDLLTGHQDLVRIANIPATALRRFRVEYGDRSITEDWGGPASLDSPRAKLRWIPTGFESPREPSLRES